MEQYERFNRIYDETRDDLLRYLMIRTNAAPEAEDCGLAFRFRDFPGVETVLRALRKL